jgi:hypothetical protein
MSARLRDAQMKVSDLDLAVGHAIAVSILVSLFE